MIRNSSRRSPRACARSNTTSQGPGPADAKDRLLVALELQQTRSEMEIARLQSLRRDLEHSRQRLHWLYQHSPVSYVTLDEKGMILDWNGPAAELLRLSRLKSPQLPLTVFVAREDVHNFLAHLRRCRRMDQRQVVSELRLKLPGGAALAVQLISMPWAEGTAQRFQTALVDLSERKKNERALEKAKEFSDAIVQTVHGPLLVLDRSLKIVRTNEAFGQLFKTPLREAKGMLVDAVLNLWWSGNALRKKLEEALVRDLPLRNFELEVQLRDLGRRIFLFNARRLHGGGNAPPLLLVAMEDITQHKQAQEELAETNRQLQQLNDQLEQRVQARTRQLEESNQQLERLCYSIAHDLRGPLRAMAGFSSALLDDFGSKLGPEGRDYAERIVAAGLRMDELIRDLLDFGRLNTEEFPPGLVDAERVLGRVLERMQAEIRQCKARILRRGPLPRVRAHPEILETVFCNLLSNALKFVPPEAAPEVTIWAQEEPEQFRIWVADNGIGIDSRHHRKIFDVFQRLHSQRAFPGTGIGLAIVRTALQRIGGNVGVESNPGQGSRFWISLPKAENPNAENGGGGGS